jgi:DNA topoisomerase IB
MALQQLGPAISRARPQATLVRAVEQVARRLGNIVAVCRKMLHPAIFDGYLDGTLERRVESYQSSNINRMSAEEAAVTAFLRLWLRSAKAV